MLASLRACIALQSRQRVAPLRSLVAVPASRSGNDGGAAAEKKSRWQLLKVARKAAPAPKRRVPASGDAPERPSSATDISSALTYIRESSWAKFDESIDVAVSLNIDARQAAQMVRTHATLPHGTGRIARVAVLDDGEWSSEDENILCGGELLDETVAAKGRNLRGVGVAIAPAHYAAAVARRAGRALGPKGLLPALKDGTVLREGIEFEKEVKKMARQWVRLRADRNGIIHARVGRVSMENNKVRDNVLEVIARLNRVKPSSVKKRYVASVSISSTMGKSVRLDLDTLAADIRKYKSVVEYE